jgi:hypothetical protein
VAKNVVQIVEQPVEVTVDNNNVSVNLTDDNITLVLGQTGPQGPKGDPGIVPSDLGYVHTQSTPSSTWTIEHNLQFIPNITVVDSAGTVVEGSYSYPNSTTVILSFTGSFSGKAYLS